MKKSIFLSFVACLLFACNGQNPLDPNPDQGGGGGNQDSTKNYLKSIEADYYGEQLDDLQYVSMRFVTSNVGYVTNADSTVSISGNGAIVDILLVASAVDENNVPIDGSYTVGGVDAAFTALNTQRIFDDTPVNPAVYKVSDGEVGAAIAYTSGSVSITRIASQYRMTFSLACSDGFTRTYTFNGQITVIDKTQSPVQVSSIAFVEQGPIEMAALETRTLHIEFTPSTATDNVQFSVSDPSKLQITTTTNTTCELLAVEEGDNIIVTATCAHSGCSAAISISVTSILNKNYNFSSMYWMYGTGDMQEETYMVYRYRKYRGTEITDGGDALLTEVTDNSKRFPDPGTWLHRKDTVINGQICKMGVFRDSVRSYRAWMLSSDAFFNAEGLLTANAPAPIMEFKWAFVADYKYVYVLGDQEVVSDVTASDTIRPVGVAAKPMPGYIQATRFNQSQYLNYMGDVFNGEAESFSDYSVFGAGDARLIMAYNISDQTGDAQTVASNFFGTVNSGWINVGYDQSTYYAAYYDINATVYDNPLYCCLKITTDIDPETGEEYFVYSQPLEMANSKNVNYTGGLQSSNMRRGERPVPSKGFQRRMRVNNTMGAVLRTYLLSKSRIWR